MHQLELWPIISSLVRVMVKHFNWCFFCMLWTDYACCRFDETEKNLNNNWNCLAMQFELFAFTFYILSILHVTVVLFFVLNYLISMSCVSFWTENQNSDFIFVEHHYIIYVSTIRFRFIERINAFMDWIQHSSSADFLCDS
jgi:hypothetical protein